MPNLTSDRSHPTTGYAKDAKAKAEQIKEKTDKLSSQLSTTLSTRFHSISWKCR